MACSSPQPARPRRAPVAVLSWVLWLWLAALPAAALPPAPEERLVLALEVNGVARGEVFPLRSDGRLLMESGELLRAGILPSMLPGRRETRDGRTYLVLDEAAPDLRYTLDERRALLRVTVSLAALPLSFVDLRAGARPDALEVSQPASGFLNYAARMVGSRLSLQADAGASLRGALLTTTASWAPGAPPVRGLTRLSFDEPSRLLRWTFGDAITSGGPLGGGAVLAGLHVSREFGLDPYGVYVPTVGRVEGVSTPSTLEVYVNDMLVRRLELPPGPVSLQDLPLARGANQARYVIRDAFGRTREVTERFYLASDLLAPGYSDLALSAGFRREHLSTASFDYGPPALIARYRRGMSSGSTVGARLEAALDRVSGGPELARGLPVGELSLSLSGSFADGHAGAAGQLKYAFLGRQLGLGLFARAMSRGYSTVSLEPEEDRPLLEAGGSVTTSLGRVGSVGVQGSASSWKGQGRAFRVTALGGARLTRTLSLAVSAGRAAGPGQPAAWEGQLSLSLVLGAHATARLWREQGERQGSTAMDVLRTPPVGGGWGYRVQGQHGVQDLLDASAEYQGTAGRAAAGAEWREGVLTPRAEVSGALVAMDGEVLPTRSVEQGFALVRVPGAAHVQVRLNNQDVGRTNASGAAIVPGLLPYYANRVSISEQDLPPEFAVAEVEHAVAPVFRGGALVRFDARRFRALRGTVVLKGPGGPVIPSFGELAVTLDAVRGLERRSPLGRQGEFELEGLEPGLYRATVESPGGTCVFILTVPSGGPDITELGQLRCGR
ncbi:fimbria/pilus outer membrane usher protein [Corallococcus caeni]|uniref:fimbria/pilus outer membrane usher protein n=1 Tax=Corallococcus caeni TaxID=3082388 RepID=UPI002956E141|nr:fimbria/pilus outer membrane usher protein [Corallococcus sp. KH5-1]